MEIRYKTYPCSSLATLSVPKPLVAEKRGMNSTALAFKTCWSTFPAMLKYKKTTGNGNQHVPVFLLFTRKLPSWKLATFKHVFVLFVFLYLQYKLRLIHSACQQAIML